MTEPDTGTPDHVYDLIVTLQRALEDAWRFTHFTGDAKAAGDNELADFFRELADSDRDIAVRCQALLHSRTPGRAAS